MKNLVLCLLDFVSIGLDRASTKLTRKTTKVI